VLNARLLERPSQSILDLCTPVVQVTPYAPCIINPARLQTLKQTSLVPREARGAGGLDSDHE